MVMHEISSDRIYVPDDGYLGQCLELCKEHNVLFMVDEIQSGLGRAGTMLAVDHEGVRPDVLILGKALSGGVFPVSAVLADRDVMLCIQPGEHGSTYGGNPLGCAVALAGLQVLQEDNLVANSAEMGAKFRAALKGKNHPAICDGTTFIRILYLISCVVRGRGLMNAIDIDETKTGGKTAWDLCMILKKNGLPTKPTHEKTIRLTPPLCITEAELQACLEIIFRSLDELAQ
jgi:ornithine--oxo-acid transaminase